MKMLRAFRTGEMINGTFVNYANDGVFPTLAEAEAAAKRWPGAFAQETRVSECSISDWQARGFEVMSPASKLDAAEWAVAEAKAAELVDDVAPGDYAWHDDGDRAYEGRPSPDVIDAAVELLLPRGLALLEDSEGIMVVSAMVQP